ncbi:MAG: hypothetical protein DMG39_15235 [Acidobacteria bacterium]|nr:MAG: hypothetical protein DMG39_15235 [Acidobacteriota bacterium]
MGDYKFARVLSITVEQGGLFNSEAKGWTREVKKRTFLLKTLAAESEDRGVESLRQFLSPPQGAAGQIREPMPG